MRKIILLIIVLAFIAFIYTQYKKSLSTEYKKKAPSTQDILTLLNDDYRNMDSDYVVDTENTSLTWTGSSVVKTHVGNVDISSVHILEKDNLLSGLIIVDMNTLSGDGGVILENHLKSNDFFSVEDYPNATLSFRETSFGLFDGVLTIRGISSPISFNVERSMDVKNLVLKTEIIFNRTTYGINFRSATLTNVLKDKVIDDDIFLNVVLSLIPKTA